MENQKDNFNELWETWESSKKKHGKFMAFT